MLEIKTVRKLEKLLDSYDGEFKELILQAIKNWKEPMLNPCEKYFGIFPIEDVAYSPFGKACLIGASVHGMKFDTTACVTSSLIYNIKLYKISDIVLVFDGYRPPSDEYNIISDLRKIIKEDNNFIQDAQGPCEPL